MQSFVRPLVVIDDPSRRALPYFLLAWITFSVHAPALLNGFINWDDPLYVTENPLIRYLDSATLRAMFTHFYAQLYIPLVFLTYSVDYAMGGLNPLSYHLQNLLWHVACTLLVYSVARRLGASRGVGWLTALLFGVHPIHVESVGWITERKDVLFGCFFFAGLAAHLQYRKTEAFRWYGVVLICFVCSLFSKIAAVVFPPALVLCDYAQGRRILSRQAFLEYVPFWVIGIGLGLVTFRHLAVIGHVEASLPMSQRLFVAGTGLLLYAAKAVWPLHLSLFYPAPSHAADLPWVEMAFGTAVMLAAGGALARAGRSRLALFCVGFFVVSVLPVLQLIPAGNQIVADRYLYIGLFGIGLLTVSGLAVFLDRLCMVPRTGRRLAAGALALLIAAALSWLCWQRHLVWRSSLDLWQDASRQYPHSTMARLHYAISLGDVGNFGAAEQELRSVARADSSGDPYVPLAAIFLQRKEPDRAIAAAQMALQQDTGNAHSALLFLAYAYLDKGERAEAQKYLLRASRLQTGYPNAHLSLAEMALEDGKTEQTLAECREILVRYPHHTRALWLAANALQAQQRWKEAASTYEHLLRLQPLLTEARANLAICWTALTQPARARIEWERVITLEPTNAKFHYELGNLHLSQRDFPQAVAAYQKAIYWDSQLVSAHANLAAAYLQMGRQGQAEAEFKILLALQPDHLGALANLANLRQQAGRDAEAIPLLQKALAIAAKNPSPNGPTLGELYRRLGQSYAATGEWTAARQALEQAQKQGTTVPSQLFNQVNQKSQAAPP